MLAINMYDMPIYRPKCFFTFIIIQLYIGYIYIYIYIYIYMCVCMCVCVCVYVCESAYMPTYRYF